MTSKRFLRFSLILNLGLSLGSALAFADKPYPVPVDPRADGFKNHQFSRRMWIKHIPGYPTQASEDLGFDNRRSTSVRSIVLLDQKILWDVRYNFDEYGRRLTWTNSKTKDRFLTFYGCSFTFGIGLNDEDTFPSLVAKKIPNYRVYNAGIKAMGPHQLLGLMNRSEFPKIFPEKEGLFVYVYIADHIARANGFYPHMSWAGGTPSYRKVGDEWVYEGSIKKAHPIRSFFTKKYGIGFISGKPFPKRAKPISNTPVI